MNKTNDLEAAEILQLIRDGFYCQVRPSERIIDELIGVIRLMDKEIQELKEEVKRLDAESEFSHLDKDEL